MLRWPLLVLIGLVLLVELLLYAILRIWVFSYECLSGTFTSRQSQLRAAKTFVEWASAAKALDLKEGRDVWKSSDQSNYFDASGIRKLIASLRLKQSEGDFVGLRSILEEQVFHKHRIWIGFDRKDLYANSYFGTKEIIYDFIEQVIESVAAFKDYCIQSDSMDLETFAEKCLEGYGHSALCLSGGGGMGYYHFGIIKALLEIDLLPKIISGASAGAMVASFASVRTDEELWDILDNGHLHEYLRPFEESWGTRIWRFMTQGCIFSNERFKTLSLAATMGDTTFLEAKERTGRILNIPVTSAQKHASLVVLNYLTAPHVCIWSAILASSSIPGLLKPTQLHAKDPETGEIRVHTDLGEVWFDGSIKNDVPRKQLAEVFNVTRMIVCQVNPHIVPFLYNSRGASGDPSPHTFGSRLRGGFITAAIESLLKLDMLKWLRLVRELDLIPGLDLRSIWLQRFVGDVTIHPRIRHGLLWAYTQMLNDPDQKSMDRFLLEGQRMTWPKLCMISNHSIFEKLLSRCLNDEKKRSISSLEPLS